MNKDISFDVELQEVSGQACRLFSFDRVSSSHEGMFQFGQPASLKEKLTKIRGHFKKAYVGKVTFPEDHKYRFKVGSKMLELWPLGSAEGKRR